MLFPGSVRFSFIALIASVAVWVLAALPAAGAQKTGVVIDSSVTIVESAEEPGRVRRATDDLRNDFLKVFGQTPGLVSTLEEAGPVAILIADRSRVHAGIKCTMPSDPESFAFFVLRIPGRQPLKRLVCLTGADMRGTLYGISQFSQRYLGVDPMYLWTDKQPDQRNAMVLPQDFARTYPK